MPTRQRKHYRMDNLQDLSRINPNLFDESQNVSHYIIENNFGEILFDSTKDLHFTKDNSRLLTLKEIKFQVTYEYVKMFVIHILQNTHNIENLENYYPGRYYYGVKISENEDIFTELKDNLYLLREKRFPQHQSLINFIQNYRDDIIGKEDASLEEEYSAIQKVGDNNYKDYLQYIIKQEIFNDRLITIKKYYPNSREKLLEIDLSSYLNKIRSKLLKILDKILFKSVKTPTQNDVNNIIEKQFQIQNDFEQGRKDTLNLKKFNICFKKIYGWGTEDYLMFHEDEDENTLHELLTTRDIFRKIVGDYVGIYKRISRIIIDIKNMGPEYQKYFGLEHRRVDMENEDDKYFPFIFILIERIFKEFRPETNLYNDLSDKFVERFNNIKEDLSNDQNIPYPKQNKYYAELLLNILEEGIFPQLQVYVDPLPNKLIKEYVLSEKLTHLASIQKAQRINFIMYEILGSKSYIYKNLILIKYSKLGLLNLSKEESNLLGGFQQTVYPVGHPRSFYPNVKPIRRYIQNTIGSLVPLRTIFSIDSTRLTSVGGDMVFN
jgi:hypothetical protein